MAEDKVAELESKLAEKTAENAELLAKIAALKEQVEKLLGEGGVDGVKDKLAELACGSDDAKDGGEETPPVEAAKDLLTKKALSFF